jgi:hypothetical protein
MNKMLLGTGLVALCGLTTGALPAFAQSSTSNAPAVQTEQSAMSNKPQQNHQRPLPAPGTRECLRDTGSLIPPPKGQCLPVSGTSYSRQDIQRTGATNVGQALQMLDPAVQVSGGH